MLHNLSCPSCGGSLTGLGRKRLFTCRYCKAPLIFSGLEKTYVPRYLMPSLSKTRAVAAFKEMLRHKELPKNFSLLVKMRESTLYYVPFYEFYGRRMGTRLVRSGEMDPSTQMPLPDVTEVHLGDFTRYLPACRLPDWGLEHIDLRNQSASLPMVLEPYEEGRTARGVVLTPDIPPEQALENFTSPRELQALTLNHALEIAETRFSLIYYPVWVMRYEFRGKIYVTAVDGYDGRLLRGRAPRDESRRVGAMLAVLALAAFPLAKTARLLFAALGGHLGKVQPDAGLLLLALWSAGGVLFSLAVLTYGWNMFRFSQEMIFFPGGPDLRYIGKPPRTALEKAFDAVMGALSNMAREALSARKREADSGGAAEIAVEWVFRRGGKN
jgi:hypothetical protein